MKILLRKTKIGNEPLTKVRENAKLLAKDFKVEIDHGGNRIEPVPIENAETLGHCIHRGKLKSDPEVSRRI